ncbi:MAG: glycosyltransferase [Treponema sp.]|nr:MAG: glycosyltransferase [Treponema sp.]
MNYAPIVIPTLNRFEHLKNCVESLKNNKYADKTDLIVALDYPPAEKYEEGWKLISGYLDSLSGFKQVIVVKREKNLGAIENIKSILGYVCEKYETFIFTEDDNIFAKCFLDYANKGLEKFKDDKSIESISGYSYPISYNKNEFNVVKIQRYFSDWGFATWKDRYLEAKDTLTNDFFEKLFKSKNLCKKLRSASKKNYTRAISFIKDKNVRPYDYTNSIGQILLDRFSIMPKETLVKNTGWDNSGVHCDSDNSIAKLFNEQHLSENIVWNDFYFDEIDSLKVDGELDKSLIGEYNKIDYLKVRVKEFLYRHNLFEPKN